MSSGFGKTLRRLRMSHGKSMGELARHLGVTVPYVSDVEINDRVPFTPERIAETAKFLRLTSEQAEQLYREAAKYTGSFQLDARNASSRAREVGAALMRGWPSLNDQDLKDIVKVVRRRTREGDADRD